MTWHTRLLATCMLATLCGPALAEKPGSAPQAGAVAVSGLVTVELFTSQGCSSCPPADAFLSDLAKRKDVLALTLPIDYWDYLGWRDTLARPEHTERQYAYAKSLGTMQPYTPQVVVDGRIDVVGSDRFKVNRAIRERQNRATDGVSLTVVLDGANLVATVGPGPARESTLWLVAFERAHTVAIHRGENRGKTFVYTNVVRSMSPIGMWSGAPATFTLPRTDIPGTQREGAGMEIAVILQASGTGPILGAARLSLP